MEMLGTRSRRGKAAIVVALAMACVATASSSSAAEPTQTELREARDLFARAEKDEKAGDWNGALEKLRRITQIKVTPGVRFHIALAEEKTGQLVAALADFALAEKQATDEKNREVLAALKDPIAALQARVPRLVVKAPPDVKGLEVVVDGKTLAPGLYAAEMPVDPKAHTVDARAPGRKPFTRTIIGQEREITTVDVVLDDDAKPAPTPGPAPLPTPRPAPVPTPNPPPSAGPSTSAPPPKSESKTAAIVATVGAVALIGAGVGAFFIADGQQSDGKTQCAARTPQAGCDDLRSPVRTWDTVALATWVGGAALATVAVILWAKPSASATTSTTGRLFVGPGAAGVAGTF